MISFCFSQNNQYSNSSNALSLSYQESSQLLSPSLNSDFSESYLSVYGKTNLTASNSLMLDNNYLLDPSLAYRYPDSTLTKEKWYKTDTGTSLIVAGGLITTGTIMHFNRSFKVGVRDEINRYLPNFHDPIDDYTQYVPFVAVFAFDAAGVRSKHTTYRKLTTMGTAIALNLIVIQGLKYSIAEPRPDGSSNNSFPSGHTATAFMGAHIFHKEYGERSPFYSIAGYVLASFTGVLRQLNNRHWVSDVFAGAGIGIGVTELAYFLNDGWWDEKGINEIEFTERTINELKPSFIGIKVGYASLVNAINENEPGITSKAGFRISTEGAYFFNKYVGVGGEIGFQSFPNSISPEVQQEFNSYGFELLPQSSGNRMYYGGVYGQIPFGKNAIGTKFVIGGVSGPSTKIYARELGQDLDDKDNPPTEYVYANYESETSFSWATGITFKRRISKNLSLGFYADYNWASDVGYSVVVMNDFNNGSPTYFPEEHKSSNYDSYAFGANIDIMLW